MKKGINIFYSYLRSLKIPLTGLIITDIMLQSSLWSLGNPRLIDPLHVVVQVVPNCLEREQKTFWDKTNKALTSFKLEFSFVCLSQYALCSPAWRFCTTWVTSCKGPIVVCRSPCYNGLLSRACCRWYGEETRSGLLTFIGLKSTQNHSRKSLS